jgi:iron complex transport system substrate-binding protein
MTSLLPRRIACLQPSATVILAALGKLDRVVACTRYCADVVPEVADGSRLIVSDSWTAESSQITNANPDLVIASVPYQEKAVSEIMKAGVRFLGLAPHTLSDIYTDIAAISGLVGALDRGEKIIAEMIDRIEQVRARAFTVKSGP